jgi:LysM repeat protein
MAIQDDFQISATGDIRRQAGASTTVYSVLALHAWLQDLADDATASGNDLVDILAPNPSRLDGPRDAAVASRLNLLTSGSIIFNLDDTAAQFVNFGSIKQDSANVQYSGLKTIGGIVAASPVYVVQSGNKLTKFWSDGHIQILVKVKTAGSLIDSGNVTAFSRKWGQSYSHFDVDLSAGGESNAALSTALDSNIVLSEASAAALSSKVTVTFGDTTQDLGNGNGSKLYKGTITLSNSCTLQEAYQYLQYLTRENSTATLNSIPGWRYRVLNSAYTENAAAPFGTFAGGTFFVAQGWWLTGVLASEATKYQLIAHDGTTQVPPTLIGITVGNLVAGDNVLVARADGGGNVLNDEYTPVAASAGATSLQVVESIKTDTPSSGVIRIKNLPYTYTAFNGGTKTFTGLSPVLASNIVTADDVFVPFIDKVATGASESKTFIYSANFTARVKVRQGSMPSPIISFETLLSVNNAGGSVNASRNSDV